MGAKDWGDEEAGVYAEKNKKEIETANLKEMLYQRALEHEMSLEAAKAAEKFTAAPTKPDETTYRRILGLPIELQRMTYSHLPFYDAFTLRQTNRYFRNIIPPVRDIPAQFAQLLEDNKKQKLWFEIGDNDDDPEDEEDDWYNVLEELEKSPFMKASNVAIYDVGREIEQPLTKRFSLGWIGKEPYWMVCDNCNRKVKIKERDDYVFCWKCGGWDILSKVHEEQEVAEENNSIAQISGYAAKRAFHEFAEGQTDLDDVAMTFLPKPTTRVVAGDNVPLYDRLLALPQELQLEIFSSLPFYDLFSLRQTNRYFRDIIPPLVDIPAIFAEFLTVNTKPVEEGDRSNEDGYSDGGDEYVPKEVLKGLEESSFMSICNLTILDVCSGDGPLAERLALVAAARPTYWMICSEGCQAWSKADWQHEALWCWKCRSDSGMISLEEYEEHQRQDDRQKLHRPS